MIVTVVMTEYLGTLLLRNAASSVVRFWVARYGCLDDEAYSKTGLGGGE